MLIPIVMSVNFRPRTISLFRQLFRVSKKYPDDIGRALRKNILLEYQLSRNVMSVEVHVCHVSLVFDWFSMTIALSLVCSPRESVQLVR